MVTIVGHKQPFFHIFLLPPSQLKITDLPVHNMTYIACMRILYFVGQESENVKLFLNSCFCHEIATGKKKKKIEETQNKTKEIIKLFYFAKSYIVHYSCVVIVLLNTVLCRSAFSTVSFRKVVCRLSVLSLNKDIKICVIVLCNLGLDMYFCSHLI